MHLKRNKKRKNPSAHDYVDKIEAILLNYNNAFKTIYKLGKWQSCKKVIIYYFTFLQYMIDDADYVISGIRNKITNYDSSSWYNEILKFGFMEKEEYSKKWFGSKQIKPIIYIGPISWLFFKFERIKQDVEYYEKHASHPIVIQKIEERLKNFYEMLEINYKEFFRDIRSCINQGEKIYYSTESFAKSFDVNHEKIKSLTPDQIEKIKSLFTPADIEKMLTLLKTKDHHK